VMVQGKTYRVELDWTVVRSHLDKKLILRFIITILSTDTELLAQV
jgi:hypothetical protein